MADLGRYQLGEYVRIPVQTRNASAAETAPSAAPTYTLYKANDTPITGHDTVTMPPKFLGLLTGWFESEIRLSSTFSAGRYNVLIEYSISGGHTGAEQHSFDVVAGGNANGAYIGLQWYPRPHAKFLVGLLDSNTLEARKNPKVS